MSKNLTKREQAALKREEFKEQICDRIAEGEPLRQICRTPGFPKFRTVYDWLESDEEFAARFAQARLHGFDAIAEEALAIADTPVLGDEYELDGDGNKVKIHRRELVHHRKLQVHTRMQLLAKWDPKRYGDRQQVELAGNLSVNSMTDDEIRAELATLAGAGIIDPGMVPGDEVDENDISDLL